ncbi:hypothetical protein [Clostridium senegalense]|uniref:hypothetical protein n=1 Tax=Clostridium senegalense TaxID=1465809 RepID=UPI001C10172A|nr:hypothetical protein [Clostridium senegalense]MBU5227655.1 hypothetical protein [Clostridium senegalense]
MDISKGIGKSITFYYCGIDHMLINMYKYIKSNMEQNVFIYLNVENKAFKLLNEFLNDTEKTMIKNDNMKNIVFEGEKNVLEDFLKRYKDEKMNCGFSDVILIIDAKYIIENSSKNLFIKFIENLYDVIQHMPITVLVLYDFEDYIQERKIIDKEIIKVSYEKHSHRMFVNDIIPMKEFITKKSLA